MLAKPWCGWTHVTIGDYDASASYLDDVPVMCMEAFINGINSWLPVCIKFDAEGWNFYIIAEEYHTLVFSNNVNSMSDARINEYDISMFDLAKELISDIEGNLEDWISWESYHPIIKGSDEYNERKNKLTSLIEQLKEAYEVREYIIQNGWKSYCEKANVDSQIKPEFC